MTDFKFSTSTIIFHKWDYLNYLEFEIEFAIEAYRRYIQENKTIIGKIHQQLKKTIAEDKELASLEEEWKSSYEDQVYYFDRRVNESMVRTHAFSSFMSLMAFTEGTMKEICSQLEVETGSLIKIDDLSAGSGYLSRYWTYLAKVIKIDINPIEKYFAPISQYYRLRNKVAHENGSISTKQVKFIENEPNLELSYDKKSFYIKNNMYIRKVS